jgi:restriction enzyme family protein
VENLNYREKCLGKPIEQYFVKDFWKHHKKMYQNRPIYWLFSSKKGAFQVIAYMHRMSAYTVERIRAKYLLPYIENVQAKIADLDNRRPSLSAKDTKQLQQILEVCREYHDRLQVVAEQAIAFDLDDDVVVNHVKFGDIVQKSK